MKCVEFKRIIDNEEKEIKIVNHKGPILNPIQTDPYNHLYIGVIETYEIINVNEKIYIYCPDENINWIPAKIVSIDKSGKLYSYWFYCENPKE